MSPIHPAPTQFSPEQLATDPILQFFHYAHLPAALQTTSAPFCNLAIMVLDLPRNAERSVALRKLLEAKDAAVRANVGVVAFSGSWQDRVKAERDELAGRQRKLANFLDSENRQVPPEQRALLTRQNEAMCEYLAILDERLASDETSTRRPVMEGLEEEPEAKEIGGADQDRDGDPPFRG